MQMLLSNISTALSVGGHLMQSSSLLSAFRFVDGNRKDAERRKAKT